MMLLDGKANVRAMTEAGGCFLPPSVPSVTTSVRCRNVLIAGTDKPSTSGSCTRGVFSCKKWKLCFTSVEVKPCM